MKKIITSFIIVMSMQLTGVALAVDVPGPLVEANWLKRYYNDITILDVRKDVKSFTDKPVLEKNKKSGKLVIKKVGAHIPGALLVDYSKIRVKRMVDGKEVDKTIPARSDFENLMQAVGLKKGDTVVIVSKGLSDGDLTMATRLYWQLKYYGQDNMAILNGGMAGWLSERLPISNKPSDAAKGDWVATAERKEMLATTQDVSDGLKKNTQLVDNRPLSQYMGIYKKSYVYDKGHIPGAKALPTELITDHNTPIRILPVEELRELAKGMGIDTNAESITYCNSGHLASGGWFIMSEMMGNKKVKLYDGSMHEWTLNKGKTTSMKLEK